VPLVREQGDDPFVTEMRGWIEESASPARGDAASVALGRAGDPAGLAVLVAALLAPPSGSGGPWRPWNEPAVDEWIREGLEGGSPDGLEVVGAALAGADAGVGRELRGSIVLIYLLDYRGGGDPVRELAATTAARLWDEAPTLFCHHHLMPVAERLVALGDPRGIEIASRGLEDEVAGLRVEALQAMGRAGGALVAPAADAGAGALDDVSPDVRAAAIALLRRIGASGAAIEARVVAAGRVDFWPEVRIEAIRTAVSYPELDVDAVHDFLRDEDPSARKEAINLVLARSMATEEVGILLANTSLSRAMRPDVRAAAAHAIGKLCIVEMAGPMGNVVFYGTTPEAGEGEIQAAAAAAEAIGMLGDPAPLEFLMEATRPGLRLEIRLAAIGALGLLGQDEARKVLEPLSTSPDPAIRARAVEALASLDAGAVPSCR
jgi:HEAT repeat protein